MRIKIPDNLTSLAYKAIRRSILEGRFDRDGKLTEESLAQQLGISKSPIREALTKLESDGLIRIQPRRGAYLRTFSPDEIRDLYDLREALEVHVVRTATLTAPLLKRLRASGRKLIELRARNDKTGYIEEDIAFHAALAEATGNRMLTRALENLQSQILLVRRKTYDLSSSTAASMHDAIVTALESNDRETAQALMREHISSVAKRLIEHLRSLEASAVEDSLVTR